MNASPHRHIIDKLFKEGLRSDDMQIDLEFPLLLSGVRNVSSVFKPRGYISDLWDAKKWKATNCQHSQDSSHHQEDDYLQQWCRHEPDRFGSECEPHPSCSLSKMTWNWRVTNSIKFSFSWTNPNKIGGLNPENYLTNSRCVASLMWSGLMRRFSLVILLRTIKTRNNYQKVTASLPKRLLAHNKLLFKSVMVWTGVTQEGKTPLDFIGRNVKFNSKLFWWTICCSGSKGILLGDHLCTNKIGLQINKSWSARAFPWYWGKELWPVSSPDLNPMDFSVWWLLERMISGQSYNSVDALKSVLLKAWDNIDINCLCRTVDSVVVYLKVCVEAEPCTSTTLNDLISLIDCLINSVW